MAGILKSVSGKSKLNISKKKFAIVVAEWNEEITEALYEGAYQGLLSLGAKKSNIIRTNVPGTFELTLGSLWIADKKDIDAVISLGCVIRLWNYRSEYQNEETGDLWCSYCSY